MDGFERENYDVMKGILERERNEENQRVWRMTSDWTNFEGNSKYIKKYRIMFTVVYPMVIWPQLVLKR